MERFLVQRNFGRVDDEHMERRSRRSKQLIESDFDQITWEHSHVVTSEDGTVRTFCIYRSPSEEMVRDHADALGGHAIEQIYVIGGDVTPADFSTS
jgi:hypothetical protein